MVLRSIFKTDPRQMVNGIMTVQRPRPGRDVTPSGAQFSLRLLFLWLLPVLLQFFQLHALQQQAGAQEVSDPLEPVNRAIFAFNDTVDVYLFEPAARGYDAILPIPAQSGVSNFFDNLNYPIHLVSDLVQFKFSQALIHTERFLINTTVGFVGFVDVAERMNIPKHEEDFGTALGYHGVAEGPYIVLPFLGPSNARDAVGRLVDAFLTPTYAINYFDVDSAFEITLALRALDAINTRAQLLEAIETGKAGTLDYYSFAKSSYHQHRQALIYDGVPPEDEDDFEENDDDADPSALDQKDETSASQPQG